MFAELSIRCIVKLKVHIKKCRQGSRFSPDQNLSIMKYFGARRRSIFLRLVKPPYFDFESKGELKRVEKAVKEEEVSLPIL